MLFIFYYTYPGKIIFIYFFRPAEEDKEYFDKRCLRFGSLIEEKFSPTLLCLFPGAYQFSMDFAINYSASNSCFELKRMPRPNNGENIFSANEATHNILIK